MTSTEASYHLAPALPLMWNQKQHRINASCSWSSHGPLPASSRWNTEGKHAGRCTDSSFCNPCRNTGSTAWLPFHSEPCLPSGSEGCQEEAFCCRLIALAPRSLRKNLTRASCCGLDHDHLHDPLLAWKTICHCPCPPSWPQPAWPH